jgi:hypothetical protein
MRCTINSSPESGSAQKENNIIPEFPMGLEFCFYLSSVSLKLLLSYGIHRTKYRTKSQRQQKFLEKILEF